MCQKCNNNKNSSLSFLICCTWFLVSDFSMGEIFLIPVLAWYQPNIPVLEHLYSLFLIHHHHITHTWLIVNVMYKLKLNILYCTYLTRVYHITTRGHTSCCDAWLLSNIVWLRVINLLCVVICEYLNIWLFSASSIPLHPTSCYPRLQSSAF